MLEYMELNDVLMRADAEISAAECHGFLCGQICTSGFPDTKIWHEFVSAQSTDEVVVQDCYEVIHTLIGEMRILIMSPDFEFQLMLPDEIATLDERVSALGQWCHGFLNGFGLGSGAQNAIANNECKELIEDFGKICRVGVDDGDGISDADEEALMELMEYVKVGAISLFEELQSDIVGEEDSSPGLLH